MNKYFNFVNDACKQRAIFRVGEDKVLLGYTTFTREEAKFLIEKTFDHLSVEVFKNEIDELFTSELNMKRFNWRYYSWVILKYAPNLFDSELFNWKEDSWAVVTHAPNLFDSKKFNWRTDGWSVPKYAPELFNTKKFNWRDHEHFVKGYCPELMKLKPKNK